MQDTLDLNLCETALGLTIVSNSDVSILVDSVDRDDIPSRMNSRVHCGQGVPCGIIVGGVESGSEEVVGSDDPFAIGEETDSRG